jgi:hypothetical protein
MIPKRTPKADSPDDSARFAEMAREHIATLKATIKENAAGHKDCSAALLELRDKFPKVFPRVCRENGINPELITLEGSYLTLDRIDSNGQTDAQTPETIDALLESRRFDPDTKPPVERSIYMLANTVIATPGNLCAITAAVKVGKSAAIGGMMASVLTVKDDADTFTFTSSNPDGLAVLSFDIEQSKLDHWRNVQRTLKRAGLAAPPPSFYSYYLAGLDAAQVLGCVKDAIRRARETHGGIHSIFIDGVADCVADVNEAKECNALVSELHGMAINLDCSIICVIHLNPGSVKTRGHLGSQIERKAETNLLLDKDADGVTVIWSDKQRRAPIPKETGPCFAWRNSIGMHGSVENPKVAEKQIRAKDKADEMARLADDIFRAKKELHYGDMVNFLMSKRGGELKERTATRRIETLSESGLIKRSGKLYSRNNL